MTFHPTPAQQRFLEAALNPNVRAQIRAISRAARVHESSWRIWKHNPAFLAWYRDAWQSRAAPCTWLLDKIGLHQARHDFRYWKAMQEKYSASPPGLSHPPLTVIIRAPRPRRTSQTLSGVEGQKARKKPRSLDTKAAPSAIENNIGTLHEASG